jgi:hypothetical protein
MSKLDEYVLFRGDKIILVVESTVYPNSWPTIRTEISFEELKARFPEEAAAYEARRTGSEQR